jgi:hypothetical protein
MTAPHDLAAGSKAAPGDRGVIVAAAMSPPAPGGTALPALRRIAAYDLPPGATPAAVRAWFDEATEAAIPTPDGTLGAAQAIAAALARRAKTDNTRRAYRAGVRAWCDWCESHGLPPCLPGPRMLRPSSPHSVTCPPGLMQGRSPPTR